MSEGREGDTFFAQSHGAEDHFEVGLCLGWTEVIVHGDGDGRLGEGLGLSGCHFDCAVNSSRPLEIFLKGGVVEE